MIGIGMTEKHEIERIHTQLAQCRQHDALPQVLVSHRGPCVIQHRVVAGAQDKGQPLADIQLPDFHLAVGHPLPGREYRQ
ncbi:hypothetical protein D3C80_1609840 [compost metagenome]